MAVIRIIPTQFESLIEPHITALQAYCRRLTGSRVDGEDLYQTTIEKAYRSFTNNMILKRAFLFRIAKNTWIDGFRKKTVHDLPLLDDRITYNDANNLKIREAFEVMAEHLSVRQSVLLLMIDIFGFTAKETASHIGSTEGAVKEALKRVRFRLARLGSEQDANKLKRTYTKPEEGMNQELMELFIRAFRNGNIEQIYASYRNLRNTGLEVSRVWKQEEYIYFDFHDPDGFIACLFKKIFAIAISFFFDNSFI